MTHGEDGPDIHEELLGIINSENDRLTRLINDMLDLARIEPGEIGWETTRVDLPNVITTAVDDNYALDLKKNVTLEVG